MAGGPKNRAYVYIYACIHVPMCIKDSFGCGVIGPQGRQTEKERERELYIYIHIYIYMYIWSIVYDVEYRV